MSAYDIYLFTRVRSTERTGGGPISALNLKIGWGFLFSFFVLLKKYTCQFSMIDKSIQISPCPWSCSGGMNKIRGQRDSGA